jgi:beta-lactam-binding protein with PASTA domain
VRSARTALLLLVCLSAVLLTSGCFWEKKETAYVTEPFVNGTDIVHGFDLLRDAGLRVSIAEPFTVGSLLSPGPESTSPHGGTWVPVGTVVTLKLWRGPLGSPAVCRPAPTWTVEDLRGLSLAEAIRRVPRCFFWEARDLPPLQASDAPHLLDAYRVVSQQPAPGTKLQPGILGTGYRPTPVIFEAEVADAR